MTKICTLLLCLLLTACLPLYSNYYDPRSNKLEVHKRLCRNSVGPPDTVFFRFEKDAVLKVNVLESGKSYSIQVELSLYDDSFVSFENIEFALVDTINNSTYTTSAVTILDYSHKTDRLLKPNERIEGKTRPLHQFYIGKDHTPVGDPVRFLPKHYRVQAQFENVPEKFDILLPRLNINNKAVELPPIHFERNWGVFIYPINC